MGSVVIKFNDANMGKLCKAPAAREEVEAATGRVAANANSLGAQFRTGLYHRGKSYDGGNDKSHKSGVVGNTQPVYGMKVKGGGHTSVGVVYCGNYAAMKDNMLHNTLLKAVR